MVSCVWCEEDSVKCMECGGQYCPDGCWECECEDELVSDQ